MSTLHGRKMQVGDIVFDILFGAGRVIDDGGGELNVVVSFSNDGEVRYNQSGELSGRQRLYWKQPLVRTPKGPDDKLFDLVTKLSEHLYVEIEEYEKKIGLVD